MFEVIHVDSQRAAATEPLGTKPKFWYRDDQQRLMLFKAEKRQTGEDWAEKISCHLCEALALPHVHYELAKSDGVPGVVCETCAKPPVSLVLGNELLLEVDPRYPHAGRKYNVHAHTVEAVAKVLETLPPPPAPWTADLPSGIETALDVFVGYVMLDAWVANQDRHHENWGILFNPHTNTRWLAPTFDHGACLARNISDEECDERLASRDENRRIPKFARRAKSAFYASGSPGSLTTVEAWRTFSLRRPQASIIWRDRLQAVDDTMVVRLLDEVPPGRFLPVRHDFTVQLLAENRRRLLKEEL